MGNKFSKTIITSAVFAVMALVTLGTSSAHATTGNTSACVDGNTRSNLAVTWKTDGNVSVHTVGNKPLCADTTLFFSSYTMPDNYNGLSFANNPTATPQSVFDSTSIMLKKATDGTSNFSIKLPEACKNVQVDLYYGPEITVVTPAGHGVQYITGKIIKKSQDSCATTPTTPPVTPVVPTPEAQTPPTPTPEVEVAAPAPEMPEALPHTGTGVASIVATSAAISAVTYAIALAINKRR